jgi:hypothetical protein
LFYKNNRCIWDADANIVKACSSFYDDTPKTVCRKSGNYTISYEMKVYSTYQGYNPCFEAEGNDCPEIQGVYIKVCRKPKNIQSSTCRSRVEKEWRYFSHGLLSNNGIGDITGTPYIVGTYSITVQTVSEYIECDEYSLRTANIALRSTCNGDEDFVLT